MRVWRTFPDCSDGVSGGGQGKLSDRSPPPEAPLQPSCSRPVGRTRVAVRPWPSLAVPAELISVLGPGLPNSLAR